MSILFWELLYFFFFFGCAHGIWTFPGQGSNLSHSSDPSHCSDSARSLTHCATRELQDFCILNQWLYTQLFYCWVSLVFSSLIWVRHLGLFLQRLQIPEVMESCPSRSFCFLFAYICQVKKIFLTLYGFLVSKTLSQWCSKVIKSSSCHHPSGSRTV